MAPRSLVSQDGSTALVGGELTQAVWVFVSSSTEAPIDSSPLSSPGVPSSEKSCRARLGFGPPDPAPSFSYQWLRDGLSLTGFAGSSYVVQGADQGHTLTCEVTAINSAGKRAGTSLGVAVPAGSSSGGGSSAGAGDAGAGAGDAGGGGIISVGLRSHCPTTCAAVDPDSSGRQDLADVEARWCGIVVRAPDLGGDGHCRLVRGASRRTARAKG